jgi:hypothetical protein
MGVQPTAFSKKNHGFHVPSTHGLYFRLFLLCRPMGGLPKKEAPKKAEKEKVEKEVPHF